MTLLSGRVFVVWRRAREGCLCQSMWEAWWDQNFSGSEREREWTSSWRWDIVVTAAAAAVPDDDECCLRCGNAASVGGIETVFIEERNCSFYAERVSKSAIRQRSVSEPEGKGG